jgi:hypothetical protein
MRRRQARSHGSKRRAVSRSIAAPTANEVMPPSASQNIAATIDAVDQMDENSPL